MFFEFWLGSHFLDSQPNFLLFLELRHLMEIYLDMQFFFKIIYRFGDIRV